MSKESLPPSVVMALGLAGCGLASPCLDPSVCLSIAPCLSVVRDLDCEYTPDHPDCTLLPCLEPSIDDRQVAPDVCLSIAPPHVQLAIQCTENPEHPDCPPPEQVKDEVLEKKVLPEDVQKKLEGQE